MFIRFRQTRNRLQCSLIETRRVAGRVQHEHIASLGTVKLAPSVADRISFWRSLFERMDRLSNRISSDDRQKAFDAIAARVPMVTPDEQRQLQKENAEAEERFWSGLQDMHASNVAGHKGLMEKAQRSIDRDEAAASNAAERAAVATERLAKIDRGEDVSGGLGRPVVLEAMMLANGFTRRDLRNMRRFSTLMDELESRGIAEEYWKMLQNFQEVSRRQAERKAEREVLRKHGLQWND